MPMIVIARQIAMIEVGEREPPAGEHEPDEIAEHAERPGADILLAGVFARG